jgi:hypothetical protein
MGQPVTPSRQATRTAPKVRAGTLGWEPVLTKELGADALNLRVEQNLSLPRGKWLDLQTMLNESSRQFPPKDALASLFGMLRDAKVKFHLAVDSGPSPYPVHLLPDVVVKNVAPFGYDKDFKVTFAGAEGPLRSLGISDRELKNQDKQQFIAGKALTALAKADRSDFLGGDVGEFQLGSADPQAHWSPHNRFYILIP